MLRVIILLLGPFALPAIGVELNTGLPPVSGREVTPAGIKPADVLSRVKLLQGELDLLRKEMGRLRDNRPAASISGAAPREVYFQALTMYRKADRVAFEQTRRSLAPPSQVSPADLQPFHVFLMVDSALARLLESKQFLHIPERIAESASPEETTPSEVFAQILQANRQLNLLLDQQFLPSDVYRQVSVAINYATSLLATFPEAEVNAPLPEFERRKRPVDVYLRSLESLRIIAEIADLSGKHALKVGEGEDERKIPSDVYDLVTLVMAELAYFHSLRKGAPAPAPAFYPGRQFPSHVFQLSGKLQALLLALQEQVKQNPKWLDE